MTIKSTITKNLQAKHRMNRGERYKRAIRNLNENLKQLRNGCRKNKVRVGYNGGRSRVYNEKRKG